MNRRTFVASLTAALPLAASNFAIAKGKAPGAAGAGGAAGAHGGRSGGVSGGPSATPMMDRYELTLDRVLHGTQPAYTPEFVMEDIFATGRRRFTNFSGDVSGRWIGALATSSRTYGETYPVLDDVVQRVIAQQHAEGYFGKVFRYENQNDDDMALLWGNGRLLVGLMEYYALKPTPAVLDAAKKLGDFLVKIGPDFNTQKKADEFGAAHYGSSYICWTQQTEGLAALYAVTKEPRYRDLCVEISKRIERRPGDHVHGYLCALRGTLALYEITGDAALLKKATDEWSVVTNSGDVLLTGGVPERWSPLAKRTEGCAECDWMRLNLALYRVTGKPVYLETAERTMFNEYAMNQFSTGDFGHGVLSELGTPQLLTARAWWCCTLHGLRAFSDVHDSVFRAKGNEVFYELPVDGSVMSADFAAKATSTLATNGAIEIRVSKAADHVVVVRKPVWADAVMVTRNGREVHGLRVEKVKAGDVIAATFKFALRQANEGVAGLPKGRTALSHGPWLLGVSSEGNIGYYCESQHLRANLLLEGTEAAGLEGTGSVFDVPIVATSFGFIPAEFPDQPGRVYLRAVAEQTGTLPTQWETSFLVEDGKVKQTVAG